MKRDLVRLTNTRYDLLIIGGGVYGLFIAWDAALRGLRVGLVEKGDFGHATSSNSLRVIHGGLRYLQHGDFSRMRHSIRERSVFLRIAPHLIHPLPFLFPTYGHGLRGKEIFSLALFMDNLLGFDRNHALDHHRYLPPAKLISKEECRRLVPGIDERKLTGAAVCYDAQILNAERLLIAIAQSATQAGADLANYVEVTGFLGLREEIRGVMAQDVLSGEKLEIQANLVVNASGPWVNRVLQLIQKPEVPPVADFARAFNIMIRRPLLPNHALGVYSKQDYQDYHAILQKGSRLFIITPCYQGSLIGTAHLPLTTELPEGGVTEAEIMTFVNELNEAYPMAALKPKDISWVYWGIQPASNRDEEMVQFMKQFGIRDHEREQGVKGLISVVGVKFTEARHVAERIGNLALKKLGKTPRPSLTATTPVAGGKIADIAEYVKEEVQKHSDWVSEEIIRSLITKYGTGYSQVLACLGDVSQGWPSLPTTLAVSLAELIYGIREEGAQKFSDVIFRRMTLDTTQAHPEGNFLQLCATTMSKEMGWDVKKTHDERKAVEDVFQLKYPSLT